jgi:hypothetical protein
MTYAPGLMICRDRKHLNTLSTCYYVLSGILLFFSGLAMADVVFGILMLTGGIAVPSPEPAMSKFMGGTLIFSGCVGMLLCWADAVILFLAGSFLARAEHRTFCLVVAALTCLSFPLGTLLGVFTIMVLSRDSVKTLFQGGREPPRAAQPVCPTPPPLP